MIEEPILKKKKSFSKKSVFITALILILSISGIAYAFFNYYKIGDNQELIMGDIYLTLNDGTDSFVLTNVFPETREKAFKRTDNVITFTVDGKNTHATKDVYYGITLNLGDEQEGTRIKPEHIMIYLECDGVPVVDGVRYNDWDEQRIWVEKVAAKTNSQETKTFTMRIWVDENVMISDTNPNADYPAKTWKNHYASLKVGVDGKMETMNMPLSIETGDTMVENNKAYFITKISNFTDMTTYGLRANDQVDLVIEGTNDDIQFSYKDSLGNEVTEPTETLNLSYPFNKNSNIEVQVFVTPKNDANGNTDISITLNKNGERIQSLTKHMNVYGNNFCLNNGFNKLYDCILASDSLASNVTTAISNIEAKGEPNLNQTAPTYTYVEQITEDVENLYSVSGIFFRFGDSYELNPATGTFRIYNLNGSNVITDYLSDAYKDYYTCGSMHVNYNNCECVYKVSTTSVEGGVHIITKGDKITSKVSTTIRSEVGLYKTEDDYGNSYIFRGDVTNNNVLFGGYYWKIIRTNGDNSIRLIYNGETANATGNNTAITNDSHSYSNGYGSITPRSNDPTYVGYMYGKNYVMQTSEEAVFAEIGNLRQYYFTDGYEFDETNEVFKLTTTDLEPVAKTFSEMNGTDTETGKKFYELYPYTCLSTVITTPCEVLIKVNGVISENQAKVQYLSYSSKDKDSTRTNEMSSNAKTQLENWYSKNIVGKTDDNGNSITDYIVDGTFCNDRGTTNSTYNSGYLLNQHTYYAPYTRLTASNVSTSLKCSDIRDKFSNTSSKGNGLLEYPVALITADEVALVGGKYGVKNENYYLRTNGKFWTMTPSIFYSLNIKAMLYRVDLNGEITYDRVSYFYGLRPVINISPNVLISQGDGSVENPYVLNLA